MASHITFQEVSSMRPSSATSIYYTVKMEKTICIAGNIFISS